MSEKLLTIREVATILDITEREVIELSEKGAIPAYKVGGVYLRFKREQIELYKNKLRTAHHKVNYKSVYTRGERLGDFFYFYDFYILSAALIIILLTIIIKG